MAYPGSNQQTPKPPGVAEQLGEMADKARDMGEQTLERAKDTATAVGDTIKQNPIGTIVAVAGLAFAVGALWKLQSNRRQSEVDAVMVQLSDLAHRGSSYLPRGWR